MDGLDFATLRKLIGQALDEMPNMYSDWQECYYEGIVAVLDLINERDEAWLSEFVLLKITKRPGVYHARREPMETRREGSVLMSRSRCGKFLNAGTHRQHALKDGYGPCARCFGPGG